MKCLNKILAVVLSCIIILNTSSIAYASNLVTNSEEIQEYIVPVISKEYDNSDVTFYEYNGKYYLTLGVIKEFTRYELNETDTTITLTQGLRELVIDKDTGHLVDSDLVDQGNIDLIQYNGDYLCEGIPMLMYLGAACTLKDDKALEVLMPSITIWESIMPDYLDYYFDIKKLYGGEGNIKFSLACDIIADVLDGVSGHGLFADADTHLEDALYEILNVDMMKYESVQDFAAAQNQEMNDFLSSDVFGTILDTGANTYDAVYEALDYYSKFYVSAKNDVLLDIMTQTDDLDYASELASQIKEQVYVQSAAKANLKNANKLQNFIDIGMVAFDTATTSYNMMQYDDDTRNLFARTINQDMLEYANYYDISWNNVSDKISNTIKNTQSIVANTAIKNVAEFAIEKVTEEGAESALSAFTSKANIYAAATQIGTFVASLINYKTNQAFSADMNAIWLNTVQYDIAQLTSRMLLKERDEYHFSDEESLKKLKDMFTLYYRTIIAFSENMAVSVDEFGGKNKNEWVQYFGGTSGKSVSNYAAIYLYRITNCTIVPIAEYSGLNDDLLKFEWINSFKKAESSKYEVSGNLANGGFVAEFDDGIFYILKTGGKEPDNQQYTLYRLNNTTGKSVEIASAYYMDSINVAGNYVYYRYGNKNDSHSYLCKMNVDGTEKTNIISDWFYSPVVIDDWIYFAQLGSISRCKTDGSSKQNIVTYNDDTITTFCIVGNQLYYVEPIQFATGGFYHGPIHKINLDGSLDIVIVKDYVSNERLMSNGELLFFDDSSTKYMSLDGNQIKEVTGYYMLGINADKENIYSNHEGLHSIDLSSNKSTTIVSDVSPNSIFIVGDWLYYLDTDYTKYFAGTALFKVKKDGSENQQVVPILE